MLDLNQGSPTPRGISPGLVGIFGLWILIIFLGPVHSAWGVEVMMDGELLPAVRQSVINYMWIGHFAEATRQEEKALRLAQAQYGPIQPQLVPILNDLGTLYRIQAEYPQAEESIRWGLSIREKVLGLEDPQVADSLDYLASLEMDLGHYTQAQVCYQRALRISEEKFGNNSNQVADFLQKLGLLYLLMNRPEALDVLNHSLQIRQKNSSPNDLSASQTFEYMAQACQAKGDDRSAKIFFQRALDIRKKDLPANRSEVLEFKGNLAAFYRKMGQKKEADALDEQIEKIRDQFLTTDDYVNIPTLQAAAMTDLDLGRWKSSRRLLKRVLKLLKKFYGPHHPKVAFCLEDFAALDQAEGQKPEAIKELKNAEHLLEMIFDPDHPEIQKIKVWLKKISN